MSSTDNPAYAGDAMRFAYADPPYLGLCDFYDHYHGDDGRCWDEIDTHRRLIDRLSVEYPDGWALSLSVKTLKPILALCPDDVRIASWVKPFASFKPGVNPAYCWEPVIFRGGRRRTDKTELTVRDYLAARIAMQRGLRGAKPEQVMRWIGHLLGVRDCDELIDLFPGTGVLGRVRTQGALL